MKRVLLVLALLYVGVVVPIGLLPNANAGTAAPGSSAVAAAAAPAEFTGGRAGITRTHHGADGSSVVVETTDFTVSVNQVRNLRGRQQVEVSWTGAHPTGGIAGDLNIADANRQEYPVVLIQCRGLASDTAPTAERVDPTTCWTQTAAERYEESYSTAHPPWRLDYHASPTDRASVVGAPPPGQFACGSSPPSQRFVPFVAANNTTYYGGANACAGIPPEAVMSQDLQSPPGNTTYGVTGLDGKGNSSFIVWTAAQNASLGCSATVPCSLVVIPILGISCDENPSGLPVDPTEAAAAVAECEKTGKYAPGELHSNDSSRNFGDKAVTGSMWWTASNWRNRVVVPLQFAPAANICDILDTRTPIDVYGSELMAQATNQWAALFCQDPRKFKFRHVRTGEPQAKAALDTGTIAAAFVSRPPANGYSGPTVNSPVAVTGFAVSYVIDDANHRPYTQLRLTPRLIAKLLSESYWSMISLKLNYLALPESDPYRAMANNPQDVTVDPEFIALNPGIGPTVQEDAASTLLALSGDSDVLYALTSYLNSDPEARSFLDGKPDPWGMVVNPRYRKIRLPEQFWPLLDSFLSPDIDLGGCLRNEANVLNPIPILPLIAAPMSSLTAIAQATQLAQANPNTSCAPRVTPSGQTKGGTLKPRGRQQPGFRFMLALTSLGDVELLGLRTAALQSTATVTNQTARFTDASGRVFVSPTPESLTAAVRLATPDEKTRTWPMPYAKLRTKSGAKAYPGTMVVYAAVPTAGLDPAVAAKLAQFLRFAATEGQRPGVAEGQLPDGYLPLTAANGLGQLTEYATRAADAVAAQKGAVPPLKRPSGGSSAGSGGGGGGGGGSGGAPRPGSASPAPSPAPELTPWKPGVQLPVGYTQPLNTGVGGSTLPLVALLSLLMAIAAVAIQAVARVRAAGDFQARLNQIIETRRRR